MKYKVRIAQYDDLDKISAIEKATMGNYTYVDTAWNYFNNSPGAFLCRYDNDLMVGIAHLALLPDNSGWFEALRVHPDHQNKGVGKALYEKALELIEEKYHCISLSMYTGRKNVRSSGLAEKYGLINVYDHKEYAYQVTEYKNAHDYYYADWRRAEELALPLKEEYGGFVSVNRTWYGINRENVRWMADQNFFYEDGQGNFVCAGTRFQHGAKLFVLMLGGEYKKGLDFAVNLARARNIPTVTCTFTVCNEKLEKALQEYGFEYCFELITRERVF